MFEGHKSVFVKLNDIIRINVCKNRLEKNVICICIFACIDQSVLMHYF